MASLRRNNNFSNDANSTKFLFTVIKQLDLKSINWQKVADEMEISNGHAARMRYTRLKQHIEGTVPGRKGRAADAGERKKKKQAARTKRGKDNGEDVKNDEEQDEEDSKPVADADNDEIKIKEAMDSQGGDSGVEMKSECSNNIKNEPIDERSGVAHGFSNGLDGCDELIANGNEHIENINSFLNNEPFVGSDGLIYNYGTS